MSYQYHRCDSARDNYRCELEKGHSSPHTNAMCADWPLEARATPMTTLDSIIKEWREKAQIHVGVFTAYDECADQLESYAAEERKLREGLEKLRDKWKQTAKQRLSSSEAFILGTSTAYDVAADELSALLGGKE